jgi:diketogulonate reductase-like aldo/keto reductase
VIVVDRIYYTIDNVAKAHISHNYQAIFPNRGERSSSSWSRFRGWTNPQIPQIGFGVYQSPPEIVDKSVTAALEAGYRHIDSAQWYFNEEEVGSAVSKSSIDRKDVFLTTKLGHADKVAERLEESITKIGGEGGYVDLFLIHAPSAGPEKRKEQWKEMEKLVKDGKAKAIGVSN